MNIIIANASGVRKKVNKEITQQTVIDCLPARDSARSFLPHINIYRPLLPSFFRTSPPPRLRAPFHDL